jgi:hypothetical protein
MVKSESLACREVMTMTLGDDPDSMFPLCGILFFMQVARSAGVALCGLL